MTPFLKQVALHYFTDGNPGRLCFVFPNKRAALFFKKYLKETARDNGVTLMVPRTVTINEFFYTLTGSVATDRLRLLSELHRCYCGLKKNAENLDDFLYWGGILLSDFNDIDKYLADASLVLRNIAELKAMQNDYSWLNPEQKNAVSHFVSLFDKEGEYKTAFRSIWDILLDLYLEFNKTLEKQGLCYEGMVYRKLAESLDNTPIADIVAEKFNNCDKFIFTGLNALNKCERKLLAKMRDAGIAEFCWDFSSNEIKDPQNRSAHFLKDFSVQFPQAFDLDPEGLQKPEVNSVSISSSVGQAKLLPEIFKRLAATHKKEEEWTPGIETAVVLPDEGLILPVLNSIPTGIDQVNVTMGYPVKGSEFFSLIDLLGALQAHMRTKNGSIAFYHRQVNGIIGNAVFRRCLTKEEKDNAEQLKQQYYYTAEELGLFGELGKAIFREAGEDVLSYEKSIAEIMIPLVSNDVDREFLMYWYKIIVRFENLSLGNLRPATMFRLISQAASGESIPFNGEPLAGLQILGPLETRALDFENLIILSFNEGVFPRRNVASSFIPAEIRKGFDLPTYEHQDAIWAYYFYRLIQRAKNVWLVSDSRTEVSRSGEESRYLKQLEMLYGFQIKCWNMKDSGQASAIKEPIPIPKTEEHVARMHKEDFSLSPTALRTYLDCPAQFFYHKIEGLSEPEEVLESLDYKMIGTVTHSVIEELYSQEPFDPKHPNPIPRLTTDYLNSLLDKDSRRIRELTDKYIREAMFGSDISGKNILWRHLIIRYVRDIIKTDQSLAGQRGWIECIGLEIPKSTFIDGFRFFGKVDRVDSPVEGIVRILDYKTGDVKTSDVSVKAETVDAIFGDDNTKRPHIALQLYIYYLMMKDDERCRGKVLQNCIYQTTTLVQRGPMIYSPDPDFEDLMKTRLAELLKELDTPGGEWRRTDDKKTCERCKFKTICGR